MASWVSSMSRSNQCCPISLRCPDEIKGFKFLRRKGSAFFVTGRAFSLRSYAEKQTKRSSLTTNRNSSSFSNQEGKWEKPDDGSSSDYESDWEGETESPRDVNYEDELRKEVENLLEPEELAILDRFSGPDLDRISTGKWNLLHTLALSGQIPFMDELLDNGISVDMVDKDGLTALHMAVIGKKEAVISHLLRRGASPHVKDKHGAAPLHHAVQVGALQTVKLLIKYKVDVNVADLDGWTPLHISMQTRNRDVAKVLLVNGADKTRKNKDGKTPLDLALCYGKDFEAYDLTKLMKLVPADREY